MKNDKLLTELCRIEAGLQMGENVTAWVSLKNLIEEVKDEIRDECNRENGKSSVANAAKRILDTARSNTYHESLYKAYRGSKGVLVCDNARAVRFNLDTAPTLEEHPENYHDYPDIDRVIDGQKDNTVTLNVPCLAELRAYIKTEKARLKAERKKEKGVRLVVHDEGGREIHLDAVYLLDMFEALPGATITTAQVMPHIKGLYFKAENGDGVLLPLKQPKK